MVKGFCLVLVVGMVMGFFGFNLSYGEVNLPGGKPAKEVGPTDQIVVVFKKDVTEEEKAEVHQELKAISFKKSYGNYFHVVTINAADVEEIIELYLKNPLVKSAEQNYAIRRNNRIIGAIKRNRDID